MTPSAIRIGINVVSCAETSDRVVTSVLVECERAVQRSESSPSQKPRPAEFMAAAESALPPFINRSTSSVPARSTRFSSPGTVPTPHKSCPWALRAMRTSLNAMNSLADSIFTMMSSGMRPRARSWTLASATSASGDARQLALPAANNSPTTAQKFLFGVKYSVSFVFEIRSGMGSVVDGKSPSSTPWALATHRGMLVERTVIRPGSKLGPTQPSGPP
mmetsp:Transcript_96442/g.274980  ORF Transcript_96442/g.274980 Transcript_96442/m.274980 type:complete len:218 (-) Transcript_96442:49-702(-)